MSLWKDLRLVGLFHPKLFVNIHCSHSLGIRKQAHQSLSHILDFIVLVQELDMAVHYLSGFIAMTIRRSISGWTI